MKFYFTVFRNVLNIFIGKLSKDESGIGIIGVVASATAAALVFAIVLVVVVFFFRRR